MIPNDTGNPLVSVIIPVKNGGRFLSQAIESVLAQDYEPIELLVVDGRSTDNTPEVARQYESVRYILQEGDPGIAAARNLGIAESRGEFIAFISSDDYWDIEKLRLQVQRFVEEPELQYCITKVHFFLQPGSNIPRGFKPELLNNDFVGPMPESLLARKSLFQEIGGFDTSLSLLEDTDWFVRANDLHISKSVVDKALVNKRVHDSNISTDSGNGRAITSEFTKVMRWSIDRKRKSAVSQNNN
jgi:glycosyltransferase involved in cell wall biosynthesis